MAMLVMAVLGILAGVWLIARDMKVNPRAERPLARWDVVALRPTPESSVESEPGLDRDVAYLEIRELERMFRLPDRRAA